MGNGGIDPRKISLDTIWMYVAILTPPALHNRHQLNRRMGGPQTSYGRSGEEKKIPSLPLAGTRPSVGQPVD